MKNAFAFILMVCIVISCSEKHQLKNKIDHLEESINEQKSSVNIFQLTIMGTYCLLYPENLEMQLKYADYLIRAGYPREARPFLEPWCKKSNLQAQELYLQSLLLNGCIDTIPEQIISKNQRSLLSGYPNYLEIKKTYDAINELDQLIAQKNTDPRLFEERGKLFASIKDTAEASWDFNRTLELDSTRYKVYYQKSLMYYISDEFEKAHNELNISLSKQPDSNLEAYKEAIVLLVNLEKEFNANKKSAEYLRKRAQIFIKTAEYQRALIDINTALKIAPANADYYAFRAYLHFFLKNKEAALLDIIEAERLSGKTNTPLAKKIREMN